MNDDLQSLGDTSLLRLYEQSQAHNARVFQTSMGFYPSFYTAGNIPFAHMTEQQCMDCLQKIENRLLELKKYGYQAELKEK